MRKPRLLLTAAAIGVILAGGGSVAASASTNPPPGPVTPSTAFPAASPDPGYIPGVDPGIPLGSAPGVSPASIGADGYNMLWEPNNLYAWDGTDTGHSDGFYYNNDTAYYTATQIDVEGGAWSLYKDDFTGLCLTWDGGPNTIYEKACNSSKPSELWASSPAGSDWFFWNKYLKDTDPNDCGNSYAPVVTANAAYDQLVLECPENGPTSYSTNQEWYANWVAGY